MRSTPIRLDGATGTSQKALTFILTENSQPENEFNVQYKSLKFSSCKEKEKYSPY
jgi:hypothetical protein